MEGSKLQQELNFFKEADALKEVLRQTKIMQGTRRENSAEHSWHLSLMVLLFKDYLPQQIDLLKALQMAILHDVVEIDAGDTFVYDTQARMSKKQEEEKAAQRIFGLLPSDKKEELLALWKEFEEGKGEEALYVQALDRLQPLLCNLETQGHSWKKHNIHVSQVHKRNEAWKSTLPELHRYITEEINRAADKGWLQKDE